MAKHFLLALLLSLSSTSVLANEPTEQALQLAQNGVESKTANGDTQTTYIDQNGNLKMVPSGENPNSSAKPPRPMSPPMQNQNQPEPDMIPGNPPMEQNQNIEMQGPPPGKPNN